MNARRIAAMLLTMLVARAVGAQERPQPSIDLAAGSLLFADDGIVKEGFLGGAARMYFTPRLSIGPEVAFIFGDTHSHVMVTGNLTCDVLAPVHGRPRLITPFLVAGGGLFRTQQQFISESFAHTEGAFTAGGGVRVRAGEKVSAGVEARLGWEAHLRINGFLAFRLSPS
jgi:hypothetical protein